MTHTLRARTAAVGLGAEPRSETGSIAGAGDARWGVAAAVVDAENNFWGTADGSATDEHGHRRHAERRSH